jgi:hypothetical protein
MRGGFSRYISLGPGEPRRGLESLKGPIVILCAHRDKKDKTSYEVFSLELHNKYNTYTYGKEHGINESIPVTITHVKENRKRGVKKKGFLWTR